MHVYTHMYWLMLLLLLRKKWSSSFAESSMCSSLFLRFVNIRVFLTFFLGPSLGSNSTLRTEYNPVAVNDDLPHTLFETHGFYPGTVKKETFIFHFHRVTKRILDTLIASSSHLMACRQLPLRGIRRWALFWKEKAAKLWVWKRVCCKSSLTATGFYSLRTSMIS